MRKKHLERIEAWFDEYKEPPVKAIKGNRDHYAGLWIKPWYGLKKKNPPLPVFLEEQIIFTIVPNNTNFSRENIQKILTSIPRTSNGLPMKSVTIYTKRSTACLTTA
jgi:hypothetical protein